MHPCDETDNNESNQREPRRSLSDGGETPLDQILSCIQNKRRRYLLYYLEEEDDAYIKDAAQFIAACERECDLEDVPAEASEQVKIELYHVHLPKLADQNIIDYDSRSSAIRFQDPPDDLSDFVELCSSMELEERE